MKKVLLFPHNHPYILHSLGAYLYSKPFPDNREGDIIVYIEKVAIDYLDISKKIGLEKYFDRVLAESFLRNNPNQIIKGHKLYNNLKSFYNNKTIYYYWFNNTLCEMYIEEVDDSRPYELVSLKKNEYIKYKDNKKSLRKINDEFIDLITKVRKTNFDYKKITDIESVIKSFVPDVDNKYLDIVVPLFEDIKDKVISGNLTEDFFTYETSRGVEHFIIPAIGLFIGGEYYNSYEEYFINCKYISTGLSNPSNREALYYKVNKLIYKMYDKKNDIFSCFLGGVFPSYIPDLELIAKKFSYPLDATTNCKKLYDLLYKNIWFYSDLSSWSIDIENKYPLKMNDGAKFFTYFLNQIEEYYVLKTSTKVDFRNNILNKYETIINNYRKINPHQDKLMFERFKNAFLTVF